MARPHPCYIKSNVLHSLPVCSGFVPSRLGRVSLTRHNLALLLCNATYYLACAKYLTPLARACYRPCHAMPPVPCHRTLAYHNPCHDTLGSCVPPSQIWHGKSWLPLPMPPHARHIGRPPRVRFLPTHIQTFQISNFYPASMLVSDSTYPPYAPEKNSAFLK